MTQARKDFTDILLGGQSLNSTQLDEARRLQRETGVPLPEALVNLGHVTPRQVLIALAQFHRLKFIDLTKVTIRQEIIDLIPEGVARENNLLPLAQDDKGLKIAMSDPSDIDTVQRLTFILNKDIQPVLAYRPHIIAAINHYYPGTETKSVDAMLQEFTNTPIDFGEAAGPMKKAEPAGFSSSLPCILFNIDRVEEYKNVILKRASTIGIPQEVVATDLKQLSSEQLHRLAECADNLFMVYLWSPSCTEAKASAARRIGIDRVVDLRDTSERQMEEFSRSSLSNESDETIARKLIGLIRKADREFNTDKEAYERTHSEIRQIGEHLCSNGGDPRMKLIAYRVQALGERVRDLELHWDGICGWMF